MRRISLGVLFLTAALVLIAQPAGATVARVACDADHPGTLSLVKGSSDTRVELEGALAGRSRRASIPADRL